MSLVSSLFYLFLSKGAREEENRTRRGFFQGRRRMRRSGVFSVVSLVTFLSLVSSQKPSKRLLFVNAAEEEESANGAKKEVQSASDFARTLPRWDLDRHFPYTSIEDEALDEELAEIERRAKVFMETYKGRLHEKLYEAIREYEEIEEALGQGRCYSYLVESVKKTDTVVVKRRSHLSAKQSRISADYLTFFDLELAELNEKSLQDQLKRHHGLRHYKPYIDLTRKRRPHLLSEEVERALDVRRPWASSLPVVDYFQQRIAESRFKMPGENEEVNLEVLLTKTVSSDPHTRRLALKTVNEGLKTNAITNFAALALNVVAGSWHIEMKERNYRTMRSRRNESNNVPDEVVDALLAAVRTTGVDLTKKYYRLKKSILKKVSGITEFTWADRNAPLGLESDSRTFSFEEAKRIVEEGYRKFSPTMADMFLKFVEEKRIDMPAVHGKRTGAFCHSCTTKLGPFQCLNYTGNRRDVETLAHESGHACHAVLASPQGYLQFHPPLTQAETASTFGEMIVFRDLLAKSPNDEQRLSMLMSKLDSMVNTVVRQCSFDFFEELVHTARGNGTLGDDEFPKLWMHATMRYYGEEGEVFDKYEDMENLWSYVTHFQKVPFYVYAYAFADLIVGSLYSVYKKFPHGFEKKLLKLLADGATVDFVGALKPFHLDPTTPGFWIEALHAHLGSLLTEAEAVATRLGYVSAATSS